MIDKYKIAVDFYNHEINRFYNRLNISISMQILIFAGILGSIEKLTLNPVLFRIGIFLTILLSFFTIITNHISLNAQDVIIKVILKIENESTNLNIFTIGKQLYLDKKSILPQRLNSQTILYLIVSYLLFIIWIVLWLYTDFVSCII